MLSIIFLLTVIGVMLALSGEYGLLLVVVILIGLCS